MKNHFSLHKRVPGNEIAGVIVDIGHGWSASSNKEYFGVPGYGIDMVDGTPQRVYLLPGGGELAGASIAGYSLAPGEPLAESLKEKISTIQTEVDEFIDWSD